MGGLLGNGKWKMENKNQNALGLITRGLKTPPSA
jgi:hypothetical protein